MTCRNLRTFSPLIPLPAGQSSPAGHTSFDQHLPTARPNAAWHTARPATMEYTGDLLIHDDDSDSSDDLSSPEVSPSLPDVEDSLLQNMIRFRPSQRTVEEDGVKYANVNPSQ